MKFEEKIIQLSEEPRHLQSILEERKQVEHTWKRVIRFPNHSFEKDSRNLLFKKVQIPKLNF
jgi:hypothetical protein